MKRFILVTTLALGLFGSAPAIAVQDWSTGWTWSGPFRLSGLMENSVLEEFSVDPFNGALYGVVGGAVQEIGVSEIDVEPYAEAVTLDLGYGVPVDMTVGPQGRVYVCTYDEILLWDPESTVQKPLEAQPFVPAIPDIASGYYVHIGVGPNGRLYVVLRAAVQPPAFTDFLLIGTPPAADPVFEPTADADSPEPASMVIRPRTLNLKSRGRWVKCSAALPEGYSGTEIASAAITGLAITPLDDDTPIYSSDNLNIGGKVSKVDGDGSWKVKFIRYNRSNPSDGNALVNLVGSLLQEVGGESKFYYATFSVEFSSTGGQIFEGTDTIRIR
jgi:hypothetical protein